jgi:uncharacterized Fe-S cluster protein YjdI
MKKAYREYTNGEITVEWRAELCNHSGVCINELPKVFSVFQTPWVDIKGASTDEIIETVDACPTHALAWRYNNKPKEDISGLPGEVQVVLLKDGPIVIRGNAKLKMEDGSVIIRNGVTSLCRCKLSKKMPYCDGAHFKGNEEDRKCE